MRWAFRWLRRIAIVVVIGIVGLLLPVGYVELACRGELAPGDYASILPPEHHRPEANSLLTYPEWHIVHAYDDYARVIRDGDPHEFGFFRAIGGFWTSLCAISRASGDYGGIPGETKQMVYTIGVSFTAEMLGKAAYEETFGRLSAEIRGNERAPLDDLSAQQAAEYANFLQQTPWYKWDFGRDANRLYDATTGNLRDRERRFALGSEYWIKSAYARLIARAVASVGADELTLRLVLTGLPIDELEGIDTVEVVAARPEGIEIETPRYRALTHLLLDLAVAGADFVEIAGNDDILITATSPRPAEKNALFSFGRQGYGDTRHLIIFKVPDLAMWLRANKHGALRLEHIHDY